jgi:hypothetical protein
MADIEASIGTSMTLHTGGSWAGYMPSFQDLEHECADLSSEIYTSIADKSAAAAADPVPGVPAGPIVSAGGYVTKNLTALGFSARNVPFTGTGSGIYNSDLAFKDNYVFAGTYEGFRVIDATNKSAPTQVLNYIGCTVGQGDVIVYENILIRSWDQPASASAMCDGKLVGQGFEGIHIFDITDPTNPVMKKQLRMANSGNEAGAPSGCGSHTATAVPDKARGYLYVYNGGSSSACTGIDIVRISLADVTDAKFLRSVSHGRTGNSCHDNNVLLNVAGGTDSYAMCAGGNGLAMYKFDLTKPADAVGSRAVPATDTTPAVPAVSGGVENPTLLWSQSMGVQTGHSGSFTYDGKYLIYGHEPGGGGQAQCQASSSVLNKSLFFIDPETGETKGTMVHPRPQTARENCTWHNFNVIPTKAGYYAASGSYQSGISILEFTNPAAPREIAFADPAPLQHAAPTPPATGLISGGDWSTYWHNGTLYEHDMTRGLITWRLNLAADTTMTQANAHLAKTSTFATSNPQTQAVSYAQDTAGAAIEITGLTSGQAFKQGSTFTPTFTCTDAAGVESCVGSSISGELVTNTTLGTKVFKVTATDASGNITTAEVPYMVNSVDFPIQVASGSVNSTLGLTLPGTPATFAAFVPGVADSYLATAALRLTSTGGDAALSVYDPATTGVGRLVNGTSTLTNALQAYATGSGGTPGAGGAVGGTAAPTPLISYAAPVSNGTVSMTFRQNITATEGLRTGAYSKTLTFTLSSSTP